MRRIILIVAALLGLTSQSFATNSTVSALSAASALGGTELLYVVQGAADRKGTPAQFATYIYGLASGDCTISGTGAVVCLKTNGVAFSTLATTTPGTGIATALGSALNGSGAISGSTSPVFVTPALGTPSSGVGTNLTGIAAGLTAGNVTTNANLTGAVTSVGNAASLGSFSSANLLAALSTKTGTGNNVFGTAPTIDSLNATTAVTLAFLTGSTQCLQVNTSGVLSGTGSACGSGGGTGANPTATASDTAVNGVATTFMRSDAAPAVQKTSSSVFGLAKVDGTTIIAASGVISANPGVTSRTVTGTTDTILSTDRGNVVYYNSASAVAISQPAPSGSFAAGFFTTLCNINAGLGTVTPGSGNIYGAGTKPIAAGSATAPSCIQYLSDGTNFNPANPSTGAGVPAALGNTLSAAGGLTSTIFHGTATLGTSAIASQACATAVSVTATNVATTDVVTAGFSADPTATTGYLPTAMLTIVPYVASAGNIGVKVCNLTGASITPSAVTINVSAVR